MSTIPKARRRPLAPRDTAPELVRIRRFNQITLPSLFLTRFEVSEGDYLEATITKRGLLLRPVIVSRKQLS